MKNKYWILISIVGFGSAGVVAWKLNTKNAHDNTGSKEYVVTTSSMNITITSTGSAQPENRLEIKPPVAGRADRILVNEGDHVKLGQIIAWISSTERAALIDAAIAKGEDEKKSWEEIYKATPVVAPIDGTIIHRNIEPGQTFTIQDAILVMSDRLTIKAQVDETDISRIALKQQAEITLDAYPEEKIAATVDQIAFEAKTVNNVTTYVVDVLPLKTPKFMRSGMTANVTFFVTQKESTIQIPMEAIKSADNKTFVQTKSTDGKKIAPNEVSLGATNRKMVEITSGLKAGDIILVPEYKVETAKTGNSPFAPKAPKAKGK